MLETKCAGFIGLGLIGGSIAKAIHKYHPDWKLIAYDSDTTNTTAALHDGIIQGVASGVDTSFSMCDIIFLCAPVSYNAAYLTSLKDIIKEGALLTDVGSVKTEMHEAVKAAGLQHCFIGGHPMAGSEKTGYINSSDRLIENAYYILTPSEEADLFAVANYSELITSIGALPLILTYEEHDYITAAISHLPHVIASSLVNLIQQLDNEEEHMKMIAAGGFKDITRIASSSPIMWQQICTTNARNISKVLDAYIRSLIQFRVDIDNQNTEELFTLFSEAKEYRNSLPITSSGPLKKAHEIYVDLADEAGGIAAIATLLATNGINLKNIGIINNREFIEGVLRIEFYDEQSSAKSAALLRARNYTVTER